VETEGLDGSCCFATIPVRSSTLANRDGVAQKKLMYFAVPREAMHEGEAFIQLIVSVRIDD
jgi:hypothetical protein